MSGRNVDDITKDELYVLQREYYSKTYRGGGSVPWEGAFDGAWLKKAVRHKVKGSSCFALEIGTGTGRGARIMAEAGCAMVGIDYVLDPIREAVQKKGEANKNLFYVQANMFKAPFADNSFDLVLDWGVFHHIRRADTKLFLNCVTRLLKKDGRFLLGCFSTRYRHPGEKKRKRSWTRHRGHYDRFSTRKELRKIFSPLFIINSIAETSEGFYLIDMNKKSGKP
ncbi:hypothetical protein MNBD_NITROSPINAE04-2755 [hydrothermal vent metagenome]|uniref:Methyltransferase type 11 domain-containing protein n=1 Tax=hydrothermal vent metagenome TaxID=652676 RepID=A0A3B1CAA9_9ZZZZ